MSKGYYYLHENGELIYKPDSDYVVADFRESDLVRMFWSFDSEYRETAWQLLVEALAIGAKKERVMELANKWGCNDKDAENYCNLIKVDFKRDGDSWCVHKKDFTNIQESPCGFGDTILEALSELCKALDFKTTKLNWHSTFKQLCANRNGAK